MGPAHKGTKCDDDEAKDLSIKYKYRRCKGCKKVVERI